MVNGRIGVEIYNLQLLAYYLRYTPRQPVRPDGVKRISLRCHALPAALPHPSPPPASHIVPSHEHHVLILVASLNSESRDAKHKYLRRSPGSRAPSIDLGTVFTRVMPTG